MKKMHLILTLVGSFLAAPVSAKLINVNTVDANASAGVMRGVSPTLVTAIVDYRAAFGVFQSVYELIKVQGIGVSLIERNRDSITVNTGPDPDC